MEKCWFNFNFSQGTVYVPKETRISFHDSYIPPGEALYAGGGFNGNDGVSYKAQLRLENYINFHGGSDLWKDIYINFDISFWNRSSGNIILTGDINTTLGLNEQINFTVLRCSNSSDGYGSFDKTIQVEVFHPSTNLLDLQIGVGQSFFITGYVDEEIAVTWWPLEDYLIKKISTVPFANDIKRTALVATPNSLKKISSQPKEL